MGRVLFLTQVLPYPLDTGAKVRAYYVLRHLAASHEVTLASFVRADDTQDQLDHLRQFCSHVHTVPMHRSRLRTAAAAARAIVSTEPVVIARDRVAEMTSLLAQLSKQPYAVIHADQTSMVQYALGCAARVGTPATSTRPRLVLDAHNALFKVVARMAGQTRNPVMRLFLHWEARRLAAYERAAYAAFDRVVFVTAEDRADFGIPGAAVIPICGDPLATPPVKRRTGARRVTFVGALHWPPNADGVRWFLEEVWPRLVTAAPDACCTIVGKHAPDDLIAAAKTMQRVEVTGYVPDLTPILEETAVFVVPLWAGGGMRVKIVDAWTWGVPVVSTSIGAEGIAYTAGQELLLADSAQTFADAVVSLLHDEAHASELVKYGRRAVAEHYDWRNAYRAWDAIYA